MPERETDDGEAAVRWGAHQRCLVISVTTAGVPQMITLSPYNAWRIFGMMALLLGLPLSAKLGKAIKL